MSELVDLLSTSSFRATFVSIASIPYAMYLVAYLFESRLPGRGQNDIPFWRDQSRAFIPGDLGLAFMVTVCLQFRGDVSVRWANSPWFAALCIVLAVAGFIAARRMLYTPNDYTKEAWNSPTKRYHDFVMFLGFAAVAGYICLPVYVATSWADLWIFHVAGIAGFAVWVLGNVYDFTHNETPNSRQHPTHYKPIWRS